MTKARDTADINSGTNTAAGEDALENNTASNNTALGHQALYDNTTGAQNTSVGFRSLFNNTTASNNTALGQDALYTNTTGANNVALGHSALVSNTTASRNTAVGYRAGMDGTTGQYNTYMGYVAGQNATGGLNTFIGDGTGFNQTSGDSNTYIGQQAGNNMTTGQKNTILGRYTGNQNNLDIRTSSNNIVLSDGDGKPRFVINSAGRQTLANGTANAHGNFVGEVGVGYRALEFEHTVNGGGVGTVITTASSTSYNTTSDHRLKENVNYTWDATTRLKQLKPARFNFISDADTTVDGFLAHEAQAVVPEAVHGTHNEVDDDGNAVMQGIDQSKLVPLLVKTIQELEARITALEGA